jgi:hypothetical protein
MLFCGESVGKQNVMFEAKWVILRAKIGIADVEGPKDDEQDVDDRFNLFFCITVAETGTKKIDNEFNN